MRSLFVQQINILFFLWWLYTLIIWCETADTSLKRTRWGSDLAFSCHRTGWIYFICSISKSIYFYFFSFNIFLILWICIFNLLLFNLFDLSFLLMSRWNDNYARLFVLLLIHARTVTSVREWRDSNLRDLCLKHSF